MGCDLPEMGSNPVTLFSNCAALGNLPNHCPCILICNLRVLIANLHSCCGNSG